MAKRFSSNDTFVSDPREILYINQATEKGGRKYRESFQLAGPKGGSFRMSLPKWFVDSEVFPEVEPGMYFVGGWRHNQFTYDIADTAEDFDE